MGSAPPFPSNGAGKQDSSEIFCCWLSFAPDAIVAAAWASQHLLDLWASPACAIAPTSHSQSYRPESACPTTQPLPASGCQALCRMFGTCRRGLALLLFRLQRVCPAHRGIWAVD